MRRDFISKRDVINSRRSAGGIMKPTLLCIYLLIVLPPVAFAQPGLKPSDLAQLQSVGEAQVAPDGSHIVYSVVHDDRPGVPYSEAWVLDVTSGKTSRLGDNKGSASGARWSPDGKSIAYF